MPRPAADQVVLVTGASSGLGLATARRLAERGYRVFGAARRCPVAIEPRGLSTVTLDVCDTASVQAAVGQVLRAAGRIDVLVNNAGVVLAGAVEDLSPEELTRQFDTNVYGMVRVCQAVLPAMRSQGRGLIINMSSLAARVGIPFQGAYSASKWALEALSEAMSIEVRPFGVRVVLIQPGDHQTPGTDARQWSVASGANSVYAERARRSVAIMEESERAGRDPLGVARAVERIIRTPRPRLRYVVAKPLDHILTAVHRGLPGRAFEKILIQTFDPETPASAAEKTSP